MPKGKVVSEEIMAGEAARMLGVSGQVVREWVDSGKLKGRRGPLGIRLISRADVERLVKERAARASARAVASEGVAGLGSAASIPDHSDSGSPKNTRKRL